MLSYDGQVEFEKWTYRAIVGREWDRRERKKIHGIQSLLYLRNTNYK